MSALGNIIRAEAEVSDRVGQYDRLSRLAAKADEMSRTIQQVLALHSLAGTGYSTDCPECGDHYPCATARILTKGRA